MELITRERGAPYRAVMAHSDRQRLYVLQNGTLEQSTMRRPRSHSINSGPYASGKAPGIFMEYV